MSAILDAVRKKCPSGLWSQGVKLAREGAVLLESRSGTEVSMRVRAPRVAVPPTVLLYVEDLEWTCDCGSKADPCEHVAAAVIALDQNADTPGEAPKIPAKEPAHVGYRLTRQDRSLYLQRAIVEADGKETPLALSLASAIAKGASSTLAPTHDDLALDRILGHAAKTFLPVVRIEEILTLLSACSDVRLEGRPVRANNAAILPRAVVLDTESGIALRIEKDPRVEEVVARGVVRLGDFLHPIGEATLTGDLLEKLPLVRTFSRDRFAELATEVLPSLEARLSVEVKSKRLPRTERSLKPRIVLELGQRGRGLSVVPTLVYGDPPAARIDDGKLIVLGKEVPLRDEAAERRLLHRLREDLDLVPGRRVDFEGPDAARFATKLEAWAVQDPEQAVLRDRKLVARIEATEDRFDVSFAVEGTDKTASGEAVIRAWREGLSLVPLEGGGWARLPIDFLEKHGKRVADLLAARDEEGRVARAAAPQVARLCAALDQPTPPSFGRLAAALADFRTLPEVKTDVNATLRPYQEVGVRWLSFLRSVELGAVLADDMGLGKTLQTIAVLPARGQGRTLVVCPKSVVHNWSAELEKFRPGLRVALYHGPRRVLDRQADVTVTTYAMIRSDIEQLAGERFDVVVLDEAQAIKNPDSQVARAAYRLSGAMKIALSGTPVENRLDELWSVFHFASPGLLSGRSEFQDRFATPIARGEEGAAERLRELVKPFLLRRLKRDVAPELPPRTDIVLRVELDDRERAVYDAVRAATKKDVLDKLASGGSVLAALEALLRLRQAACHSALVPGQRADSSAKVETLVEALTDAAADGHKALVFSQWTSMLDLIEPHLTEAGVGFTRLDGSTNDRGGVVAKFQADDGPPVMLVSLKAGGTGLNLTAADHVFLVDPWWNPAVEDQAADRAHRIGQDKPVMVYRLVAKDTVEEGILALQEKKRALADVALASGAAAASVTREELLALLSS